MSRCRRILAATLIAIALPVHSTSAADQTMLDDLADLMAGRFDNQAAIDAGEASDDDFLSDWRQRIDAPRLGDTVFYLQLNDNADRGLYRQRILVLSIDSESESIKQVAYTLNDAERFVDAMSTSEVFSDLGPDDVERMLDDGCAQYWTKTDDGFRGHVSPETCRIISSRTGNPRRIEALTVITATTLDLAERGFDDDGNQLFGSAEGETTRLTRSSPTAQLRSASFVTLDLDASVAFYTTYLGYKELGRSEITADKSRQVVGATGSDTVRYVSLAPAMWSRENSTYAGISFIEIPAAVASPFDQDGTRPSRAGELVLAHRVSNIDEISRRMRAAGVPIVAPLGLSGSGRSRSMAVLDPNGIRVEMYEY